MMKNWAGVLQVIGGMAIAGGIWLMSPALSLIFVGVVTVVSGWAIYTNSASS